jgi:hypothetical protein
MVEKSELDPWKLFLNAMRSPVTRDRYSTRVAKYKVATFNFVTKNLRQTNTPNL